MWELTEEDKENGSVTYVKEVKGWNAHSITVIFYPNYHYLSVEQSNQAEADLTLNDLMWITYKAKELFKE